MAVDADFDKVALLLHCDGVNGSTTFTDNSPGSKIVTAYGGARISTQQSKWGGASAKFEGGAYLDVSDSADFALEADFTIEMWVWTDPATGAWIRLVENEAYDVTGGWHLSYNGGDQPGARRIGWQVALNGGGGPRIDSDAALPTGQFVHLAVTRLGGIVRMFVNGAVQLNTLSTAEVYTSKKLRIGAAQGSPVNYFVGYIDDIRITKGVARYTADFTPPTEAFPDAGLAYSLSGTVTGSTGSPVARAIRAIREDTGAYVGKTISNATTGAYTITTEHPGEHTVVAYPVTGENLPALVHHGVIPI